MAKAEVGDKPNSVPRIYRGGDHLSSPDIAARVKRPTRPSETGHLLLSGLRKQWGLFGLAPGGVYQATVSPPRW